MKRNKEKKPVYLPVMLDDNPEAPQKKEKEKTSFFTTAIPWVLAFSALLFTIISTRNTEKWTHSDFVTRQFKEFSQKPSVVFMTKMLDYSARTNVYPENPKMLLKQGRLATALTAGSSISFLPDDTISMKLRDYADDYLIQLGQFYRYYDAGIMTREDIQDNIGYYIDRMGQKIKTETLDSDTFADRGLISLRDSLINFIDTYGYEDVQDLFCLMNYNITDGDTCKCKSGSKYYDDSVLRKKPIYERIID